MGGQLLDLRGGGYGQRRPSAVGRGFLQAGDSLGNLSAMIFQLALKQQEEERRAQEKEVLTSAQLLPFLRLQQQIQRQAQLDQRHAEERKVDLEFRSKQQGLAEQRLANQDRMFQLHSDRFQAWKDIYGPGFAARQAAAAAATTSAKQEAELNRYLTTTEQQQLNVPPGTRFRDVAGKPGAFALSPDKQKAKAALIAKLAIIDRGIEAANKVMVDPPPELSDPKKIGPAGIARLTALQAKQWYDAQKLYHVPNELTADAEFLLHPESRVDRMKEQGTGPFTENDAARVLRLLPDVRSEFKSTAIAKLMAERKSLLNSARTNFGMPMEEVLSGAESMAQQWNLKQPPADAAPEAEAVPTPAPRPGMAPVSTGAAPAPAPAPTPDQVVPSVTQTIRYPDGSTEEVSSRPSVDEVRRIQQKKQAMLTAPNPMSPQPRLGEDGTP